MDSFRETCSIRFVYKEKSHRVYYKVEISQLGGVENNLYSGLYWRAIRSIIFHFYRGYIVQVW